MSKNLVKLPKVKLIKSFSSSRTPSATSSLYSGSVNAQRGLQKSGSLHPLRSTQQQQADDRIISEEPETSYQTIEYHPWKPEYNQIVTREKIKKSMTKDPYLPQRKMIAHAQESTMAKEKCFPELLPAEAVHIATPNVQEPAKLSLPRVVRYLRSRELLPSEQVRSRTMMKQPTTSLSQYGTKQSMSTIPTSKRNSHVPILSRHERLLNRSKMLTDASVIRRPPRRLVININREAIVPLSIYT
ncbi:unnamed protein product [Rotaria socialis]|uniref:Uncharacterized protein n=1 Tax=Rotaria socialis TaxID=392032 RepID=A0A820MHT2_9BILA|nr:unnamed protein product [Rotaria socialis]CAF3317337.1 unnamed protein product [Rotaria socialis]CAF3548154.1 unnamed protein product [Rotaria socialis]CAF4210661.1 unnamed protein product [Rotaria socialis]CAF4374333.1 unnamed protein product [Rotaria socialis]